jgi:hypothetical protein
VLLDEIIFSCLSHYLYCSLKCPKCYGELCCTFVAMLIVQPLVPIMKIKESDDSYFQIFSICKDVPHFPTHQQLTGLSNITCTS